MTAATDSSFERYCGHSTLVSTFVSYRRPLCNGATAHSRPIAEVHLSGQQTFNESGAQRGVLWGLSAEAGTAGKER